MIVDSVSLNPAFLPQQKQPIPINDTITPLTCVLFHTNNKSLHIPLSRLKEKHISFFSPPSSSTLIIQKTKNLPQDWVEAFLKYTVDKPLTDEAPLQDLFKLLYLYHLFSKKYSDEVRSLLRQKISEDPNLLLEALEFYLQVPQESRRVFENFFLENSSHIGRINIDEPEKFFKKIRERARNNAFFRTLLALFFQEGFGTEKNLEKAKSLYLSAGENGCPGGYYFLAELYFSGELGRDYEKAASYAKLALKKGYAAPANHLLGHLAALNKLPNEALKYYQDAAAMDYPPAHTTLAYIDYKGDRDARKRAVAAWQRAAEQGHYLAQIALGFYYLQSDCINEMDAAKKFLKKALEQQCHKAGILLEILERKQNQQPWDLNKATRIFDQTVSLK